MHKLRFIMYMDIYICRCRRTECRRKRYNCTFSSGSEGTSYCASSISKQHNSNTVSSHGKSVLGLHSVWHTAICSCVTLHAWFCVHINMGDCTWKLVVQFGLIDSCKGVYDGYSICSLFHPKTKATLSFTY